MLCMHPLESMPVWVCTQSVCAKLLLLQMAQIDAEEWLLQHADMYMDFFSLTGAEE